MVLDAYRYRQEPHIGGEWVTKRPEGRGEGVIVAALTFGKREACCSNGLMLVAGCSSRRGRPTACENALGSPPNLRSSMRTAKQLMTSVLRVALLGLRGGQPLCQQFLVDIFARRFLPLQTTSIRDKMVAQNAAVDLPAMKSNPKACVSIPNPGFNILTATTVHLLHRL